MLNEVIKDSPKLASNSEEYMRLEYSLQLSMRVACKFKNMKIFQISQSKLASDKFKNRNQIETIEMVTKQNLEQLETLTKVKGRLNISKINPKRFSFGTIIDDPKQIVEGVEYTFCVFKVAIGRSFLHKKSQEEDPDTIQLKEGYDSVCFKDLNSQDKDINVSDKKLFKIDYLVYNQESVILTHIIKTQLEVREIQQDIKCSFCAQFAIQYCYNCQDYFCEEHDEAVHEADDEDPAQVKGKIQMLGRNHQRVPLQDAHFLFGNCNDHPSKKNEFYDRMKSRAYCSLCVVDINKNQNGNHHSNNLILLESAYSMAKKRAQNPDTDQALLRKKNMIKNQLELIKNQKLQIKNQLQNGVNAITAYADRAMKQLFEVVHEKNNILNSDKTELERQEREIQQMQDFLYVQSKGQEPLDFLKITVGHDFQKINVCQNQLYLCKIDSEIQVNQQLQIITDQRIIVHSLEDSDEINLNDKFQDIESKKAHAMNILKSNQNLSKLRQKVFDSITQNESTVQEKHNFKNEQDQDYQRNLNVNQNIEKMFKMMLTRVEEDKRKMELNEINNMKYSHKNQHELISKEYFDNSIVDPELSSVFQAFCVNYEKFKNVNGQYNYQTKNQQIWDNFFIESRIINDVQRCLLYFNLPFQDILLQDVKPILGFQHNFESQIPQSQHLLKRISKILSKLSEKFKNENVRVGNIILLKIKNDQQNNDEQIIGGYSPKLWFNADQEQNTFRKQNSEESSFLFNLSQNLRFNTIKGRDCFVDTEIVNMNWISFGGDALYISNNFQTVTSSIKMADQIQSQANKYILADFNLQRKGSPIDSLIPGSTQNEKPILLEIWLFPIKDC